MRCSSSESGTNPVPSTAGPYAPVSLAQASGRDNATKEVLRPASAPVPLRRLPTVAGPPLLVAPPRHADAVRPRERGRHHRLGAEAGPDAVHRDRGIVPGRLGHVVERELPGRPLDQA